MTLKEEGKIPPSLYPVVDNYADILAAGILNEPLEAEKPVKTKRTKK